ncbi:hypothetical protein [Marinobacter mangrovi]|uniref:hypothetical protein n=1 Tax=Marinobacter mangrovi TaxID=2803918 RepID=UPI00193329FF|nr:hypothetical protein [Marinobacter mangrovi]
MTDLSSHNVASSDSSGALLLLLLTIIIVGLFVFSRYYLKRLNSRHALKMMLKKENSIRDLTSYEKFQIKDSFDREIRSRHLEDYHNKSGSVGSQVFRVEGPAEQHTIKTTRGIISRYLTIGGLEVLVPTAAEPFLKDDNNDAEFVMIGDLAFVIALNESHKLIDNKTEKDQDYSSSNILGDYQNQKRLDPLILLESHDPLTGCGYFKDIKESRLLASDVTFYDINFKLLFGLYSGLIILLCGIPPLLFLIFGTLFGYTEKALIVGNDIFWDMWPFGELILFTLPISLVILIIYQLASGPGCAIIFDQTQKKVLFYDKSSEILSTDWKNLYSLVETKEWMTQYGWPMSETFLELASMDRNYDDRASIRLKFFSTSAALGAWRAIQDFMNEEIPPLESNNLKKDGHINEPDGRSEDLSVLKKTARAVLYPLLGGPIPYWLASWITQRKQQTMWRYISSLSNAQR